MVWAPIVVRIGVYMTSSDDLRIDDFSLFSGFFIYSVARERHECRKQL